MKKILLICMILIISFTGCITIGSKDIAMIRASADIMETAGKITPAEHKIITGITDKYEEE